MQERTSRFSLSRDTVKMIAICFMLLDHIAWYFLPFGTPTAQIFHTLGRATAPVMCYFLAQGAKHTSNMGRYLLRLLLFAVLSQLPWWYLHRDKAFSLNMLFTLFLCLLMLCVDKSVRSPVLRVFGVLLCAAATHYCDWGIYAPLWCLIFYHFENSRRTQTLLFSAVALAYFTETLISYDAVGYPPRIAMKMSAIAFGVLLALPLIFFSKPGEKRSRFLKWFFYAFYPLHLGVIALIRFLMQK